MRKSLLFLFSYGSDRLSYAIQIAALTYALGVSGESDLYFVVFFFPLMIVNISSELGIVTVMQSLSSISIREERNLFATQLVIFFGAIYLILTILLMAFAGPVISILYNGTVESPLVSAENLQRLAALVIFFQGTASIVGAVLINSNITLLPVLRTTLLNSLTFIFSIIIFYWYGGVLSFVVGGILGSIVTFFVIFLYWIIHLNPCFLVALKSRFHEDFQMAVKNSIHNITANFSHNFILIFERVLAAKLPGGAITLISLARSIITIMTGVVGAIVNARFVEAIRLMPEEVLLKTKEISQQITWQSILLGTLFFLIILFSSKELVEVLFERGKFGAQEKVLVLHILGLSMLGVINAVAGSASVKLFQLLKLNKQLSIICYSGAFLYVIFGLIGTHLYGIDGLVGAYAFSLNITTILLYRYLVRIHGIDLLRLPYKNYILMTLVTSGVLYIVNNAQLLPAFNCYALLVIKTLLVILIFTVMGMILDVSGVRNTTSKILSRVFLGRLKR